MGRVVKDEGILRVRDLDRLLDLLDVERVADVGDVGNAPQPVDPGSRERKRRNEPRGQDEAPSPLAEVEAWLCVPPAWWAGDDRRSTSGQTPRGRDVLSRDLASFVSKMEHADC